ncbi:MAG: DNRLRE domain-containing protein [Planctomycetes bacterium]|nr:DNRLRE domain-containing protein [Planctomycetota bacterium]
MKHAGFVGLLALFVFGLASDAGAQGFTEDFDGYANGALIKDQPGWETWSGDVVGESGTISQDTAASGSNSLLIAGGNDTVHLFSGLTSGLWTAKTKIYIPDGMTGEIWFILMNGFGRVGGSDNWAVQIGLNAGTGLVTSAETGRTLPIVVDDWVEIEVMIDLPMNACQLLYDGQILSGHRWASAGPIALEAMDLWSNNASGSYFDDISVQPYTALPPGSRGIIVDNDFSVDDLDQWQLNTNDAAHPIVWQDVDGRARLTADGDGGRAVSMFFDDGDPANPGWTVDKFTAEFTFQIDPLDLTWGKADGMTFVFAGCFPGFLGGGGGGMGWTSDANTFPSIAVEIDTWRDGGVDFEGNSENQVGVAYLPYGLGNVTPRSAYLVNPRNFGFPDFEGGGLFTAKLEFECGTFTLSMSNADMPELGSVAVLSGTFPFFEAFTGRPGFTAATGGATNDFYVYTVKVETDATGCDDRDPDLPVRINAGGVTYVDSYGAQYDTDMLLPVANRGVNSAEDRRIPIYRTDADRMYLTCRYAPMTWDLPVPDGPFRVILDFAEDWTGQNHRTFDVSIEGALALDDYNATRASGDMYTASQKVFDVNVADGNGLQISFAATPGVADVNPIINGIELYLNDGSLPEVLPYATVDANLHGDRKVISNRSPIIDSNGYIRTWLLLGPFQQGFGDSPPIDDMRKDYLAGFDADSGDPVSEAEIADGTFPVYDGQGIEVMFNGDGIGNGALSQSLYAQNRSDMNPGYPLVASWFLSVSHYDGVDYNDVHEPDVDNAISYGLVYVGYDGRAGDELPITVGACSDDSVQVLVNGIEAIGHSGGRGWCGSGEVQDRGDAVLQKGMNVLMVKTFDGGGGFGFRLKLEERGTGAPLTAKDGVSIHLDADAPVVNLKADKERILAGEAVNFEVEVVGAAPDRVTWDFNPADGRPYVDAEGASVSHTFAADEVPADRTFDVTACVERDGYLTTVEKRIVIAPAALVDEFDGATWKDGWWLDEPHHLGRGLEGTVVEVDSGILTLELPAGTDYDTWADFDQMAKLVMPVPQYSDWAIETRITEVSRELNNQLHAGIVACIDPIGNMSRPYYMFYGIHTDNIRLEVTAYQSGNIVTPAEWTGVLPYTTSLLLVKKGNSYKYYYRLEDSQPWQLQIIQTNFGEGARHVGIGAKNWGLPGGLFEFDYLRFNGEVPDDPQGLAYDPDGDLVTLTWSNPEAYDKIEIIRDGAIIATVAGSATSYTDDVSEIRAGGDPFYYLGYEVRGYVGPAFGSAAVRAGVMGEGYMVYQDGMFPTPAYTGTADAHIHINGPDNNNGAGSRIEEGTCNGGLGDHKEMLVRFDSLNLPAAAVVDDATLLMYFVGNRACTAADHTAYARKVLKPWNEGRGSGTDGSLAEDGEVTWRSAQQGTLDWEPLAPPCIHADGTAIDGGAYGSSDIDPDLAIPCATPYGAAGANSWITWGGTDLAAVAQGWVDDPASNNGLKITQGQGSDLCEEYATGIYSFASAEEGDVSLRPMLILKVTIAGTPFIRGDTDGNGTYTIGDGVQILERIFANRPAFTSDCDDTGDLDDNGIFTIGDAVWLFNYLFATGDLKKPPFPPADTCGIDPTPETTLGCNQTPNACK